VHTRSHILAQSSSNVRDATTAKEKEAVRRTTAKEKEAVRRKPNSRKGGKKKPVVVAAYIQHNRPV
jgi:hypothetical protein